MTTIAQITRQAARDDVPAPTVERDYVLAHIVAALGALDDEHGLVFKGGTALRLCYFEDYRYSADLDFSVVEGDIEGAYATIATALTQVVGAVDARDAAEIFVPKAEHRQLDPGQFEASYRARLVQYRDRWTNELEIHVAGQVPHFEQVERTVSRRLRGGGLL